MPLYQQLILCMPKFPNEGLVDLFKRHAKLIMINGGVVRIIENHGIRYLPERAKRRYATLSGHRLTWNARFVTATFDASPYCLSEAERFLRNEEGVLRFHSMKQDSAIERIRSRNWRNPYTKRVEEFLSKSKNENGLKDT